MDTTMIDFITALFKAVADFLMTEPIYYFTGIFIVIFVGATIDRLVR